MDIISQNKCSSLGMLFGAIALIFGIFHFSFGPFYAPQARLENVVAEKVSAVKKGIIAGLKGEKPLVTDKEETINIDKVLNNSSIALAVIALVCAFIGGMRRENRWGIYGAIIFGGGTLVFHTLLFGVALIFTIILIIMIFSFLSGGSPI
ncbi:MULTISPECIES: hypothetical protein [Citrobacter]|uniref:hypothetical protein n=1 Tax=unclassified Citrobacter TaxID=2644389 RepID=UPI0010939DF1|nr:MULTISPECIES: hypothetical protein [Citrobacter]MCS3464805.1 putative membrane protein [Citrobacter sp. JUb117]QCA16356.1 hypothetical protein E5284_00060 [Citrobacter freundii]QMF20214.1 hypothetical protein HVY90_00060 [Citrobacter freundii]TKU10116.1 hypothetical protein FDW88_18040 [Citrobacter sp. wls829]